MNYATGNRGYVQKNVPCPYEMVGKSAVMHYKYKRLYDDRNASSQIVLTEYKARVTPENEGRTLRLDLLEATMTSRRQEKTWQTKITQFGTPTVRLKKQ